MSQKYKLQYLNGRKLDTFLAVADRIVPPDGDAPGAGTMETAAVVDWAMNRMSPGLRKQLMLLLTVVEVMGVFFGGRPFTKNSDAAKDRQLKWMESGPIGLFRMGFFGLKSYSCMGYYAREDIWETFDYEGPIYADRQFPDPVIRGLCQGTAEVER